MLDLYAAVSISRIVVHQGGPTDDWAISDLHIECADALGAYRSQALELRISHSRTTIDCSAAGCTASFADDWVDRRCGAGYPSTSATTTTTTTSTTTRSTSSDVSCSTTRAYRFLRLSIAGPVVNAECIMCDLGFRVRV